MKTALASLLAAAATVHFFLHHMLYRVDQI